VELLVLFVAVAVWAVVQGSIGFGFALVAVPVLTLLRPEALPATVLLLVTPMAAMALRKRCAVDVPGLVYLVSGRLVGTLGGVDSSHSCRKADSRYSSVVS
jgi:uncharacterized membrane protein YfcA